MGMIEDDRDKLLNSRPAEERATSGRSENTAGLGRRFGIVNKAAQHLQQKRAAVNNSPKVEHRPSNQSSELETEAKDQTPASSTDQSSPEVPLKNPEPNSTPLVEFSIGSLSIPPAVETLDQNTEIPKKSQTKTKSTFDSKPTESGVEHLRGTFFETTGELTDTTGGTNNHGSLDLPPVVDHTTGALLVFKEDAILATAPMVINTTGGKTYHGSKNMPQITDTTGGTMNHRWPNQTAVPQNIQTSVSGKNSGPAQRSEHSLNDGPISPLAMDITPQEGPSGALKEGSETKDSNEAVFKDSNTRGIFNQGWLDIPWGTDKIELKPDDVAISYKDPTEKLTTGGKSYHGGDEAIKLIASVQQKKLKPLSENHTTGGIIYHRAPGEQKLSSKNNKKEIIPPVVDNTMGVAIESQEMLSDSPIMQSSESATKDTTGGAINHGAPPVVKNPALNPFDDFKKPIIKVSQNDMVIQGTTPQISESGFSGSDFTQQQSFDGISLVPESEPISFFSNDFLQKQRDPFKVLPQNGNFMIPHELFQAIVINIRRVHDRDVYSCLLRMSLGWHRDWCEAGLGYITKWTNISDKQNVAKALKRLTIRGLIEIIQDPDYKANRGTVYKIPLVSNYLKKKGESSESYPGPNSGKEQRSPTTIPPVVSSTTGGKPNQGFNEPPVGGIINDPPVVKETTNKETLKEIKKKTPPQNSEIINTYLSTIQAGGQRQSEREHFENLLGDGTTLEVIEIALKDLQKNGVRNGEICHMPMKYLWTSGQAILGRAKKTIASRVGTRTSVDEGPVEPIPSGHPKRVAYETWRGSLSERDIYEILWMTWNEHGPEQVELWIQNYPTNVTCQLMAHYLGQDETNEKV